MLKIPHPAYPPISEVVYTSAAFTDLPNSQPQSSHTYSSNSPNTVYADLQVFGEMPQPYGFNNLVRQSIFLADGTEHSYYVLPENYPLEQATVEPVFDVYDDESDG